ncbi:MAG: YlbF family regulator [Eubacterium sp.]|nr:YlbF family regulator [Eubacterium sp.]
MNVYDEAHKLSQAIKESEEYKQFIEMKRIVDQDPQLSAKIKEFQELQIRQQAGQLTGDAAAQNLMAQIQEMYQLMMRDPRAVQYLQVSMRFSLMMNDVFKILGDTLEVGNFTNL